MNDFVLDNDLIAHETLINGEITLRNDTIDNFVFKKCFCAAVDSGITINHVNLGGFVGESLVINYANGSFKSQVNSWSDYGKDPQYFVINQLLKLNQDKFILGDSIHGLVQISGKLTKESSDATIETLFSLNGKFQCVLKEKAYNIDSFENDLIRKLNTEQLIKYEILASSDSSLSMKSLNLAHLGLNRIPQEFKNFKNLEKLNLSNNNLKRIDIQFLKNFRNLRTLDVSYNNIQSLSDSINQLFALKSLDLSNNQISNLPESFVDLQELESLNLGSNPIEIFPTSLFALKNLEELDLSLTKLEVISNEISSLEKLHILDLGTNDLLINISQEVFNLPELTELHLPHNHNILKLEGANLDKIRKLWASFYLLHSSPKALRKMKSLRTLIVFYSYKNKEEEKLNHYKQTQWVDSLAGKSYAGSIIDNSKFK